MKSHHKRAVNALGGLMLLAVLLGAAACRLQDIRTKTIQVPQMKNEECQRIIGKALAQAEGVLADSIRFGPGTVTVTYDSMKLALKNLEFIIADAGFDANRTPANATARAALPATCR
jgi:copper chaperone CopZ